jgi:hypothetical protein
MEQGGDLEDCKSTPEAEEGAAAFDAEKRARLPRPGQVDFINGGPPCQVSPTRAFPVLLWALLLRALTKVEPAFALAHKQQRCRVKSGRADFGPSFVLGKVSRSHRC